MKYVELKNVSKSALVIPQVRGFRLNPGESMKVHPATAAHPAVRQFLPPQGSSLELVTPGIIAEVEPIAPATPPVSVPKPVAVVVETPVVAVEAPAVVETVAAEQEPAPEMAGKSLREVFIAGPGVTDENVDALVEMFASLEALSAASKDDLTDLGMSSTSAKKLLSWAKNQA